MTADTVHLPYAKHVRFGGKLDSDGSMMESRLTQMYMIKPGRQKLCSSLTIYSSLSVSAVHANACPVSFGSGHETNSILSPPPLACQSWVVCPLLRLEASLQAMQW